MRDAYLLDAFGDLGNKQQISDAFTDFSGAASEVLSTLPTTKTMTSRAWPTRVAVSLIVLIATLAVTSRTGAAHKPITSKYTFNDDVFPIFRDKCGRCHVEGGVGPMSLMTYEAAFPWAESIRVELIASHMPPANALRGFGA